MENKQFLLICRDSSWILDISFISTICDETIIFILISEW